MSLADIDRSILGKEFDRATYGPLEATEMIAYARSIGETDPLFVDEEAARSGPHGGLVAHPTFVVKLRGNKMAPREVAARMGRSGLDAGKDIELGEPLRPGDSVTVVTEIHDIYEKTGRSGTMYFIVIRSHITNQRGEMVAVVDQRMMQRQSRKKKEKA